MLIYGLRLSKRCHDELPIYLGIPAASFVPAAGVYYVIFSFTESESSLVIVFVFLLLPFLVLSIPNYVEAFGASVVLFFVFLILYYISNLNSLISIVGDIMILLIVLVASFFSLLMYSNLSLMTLYLFLRPSEEQKTNQDIYLTMLAYIPMTLIPFLSGTSYTGSLISRNNLQIFFWSATLSMISISAVFVVVTIIKKVLLWTIHGPLERLKNRVGESEAEGKYDTSPGSDSRSSYSNDQSQKNTSSGQSSSRNTSSDTSTTGSQSSDSSDSQNNRSTGSGHKDDTSGWTSGSVGSVSRSEAKEILEISGSVTEKKLTSLSGRNRRRNTQIRGVAWRNLFG